MAVGPFGGWDIWRLGHLAVGTFGGQALKGAKWAVGTWDKWLLAHFVVRGIAIRGKMAVETWNKWLLAYFVVRGIAIRG